jgi:hypothetical protein
VQHGGRFSTCCVSVFFSDIDDYSTAIDVSSTAMGDCAPACDSSAIVDPCVPSLIIIIPLSHFFHLLNCDYQINPIHHSILCVTMIGEEYYNL